MNRDELDLLIKNGFLQVNPDETLTANELNKLVSQGFLEELPNHFFTFHNNLTWEVIYETLLYAERRLLHNIIAVHIEKQNSSNIDAVADVLLHHFENSRNYSKCVLYGAKAGDREAILFSNDDAISFYKRSLSALDNLKQAPRADRSLLHEHIGDVYENSGNHKEALAHYHLALEIWQDIKKIKSKKPKYVHWKIKPSTNEAILMRKLAMSYEHNSEFDKAITWLDNAEKKLPVRPGRVAAQIAATRSATLYRKGEFLQALEYGRQALKLSRRSGRKEDEAYAHNMIANPLNETGEYHKAIKHLQLSSNICEDINDFPGIATSNYNLGNSFYGLGALSEAANYFKKSIATDEAMHNVSGITMGRFSLGCVMLEIGELDDSIDQLESVVKDYELGKARRDLTGMSLAALSKAYRLKGDSHVAEVSIKKALELLGEDRQSGILLHAEVQMAELHLFKNEPEEAKEKCLGILEKIKTANAVTLEVELERTLGNSYFQLGQIPEALRHLKKSIKIANKIGEQHAEAQSIIAFTRAFIEAGKINKEVKQAITRAVDLLSNIGAKLDLAEAKKLAAQLK